MKYVTPEGDNKPPLRISSEEEFESLMENIDQEMASENVKITARPFIAGIKITERYNVELNAIPPRRAPKAECFDPLEISIRVHEWVERRYGKRLNVPFQIGRVAFPFRGGFYILNCPKFFGEVLFVCEPSTFGQEREKIGKLAPPICNILDLIEDFTDSLAASLTGEEVVKIAVAFTSGMGAYSAIEVIEDVEYVNEAIGNLSVAVSHLTEHSPQPGLSKWESLQAVEKLIKAYIKVKGKKVKFTHDLTELFEQAEKLGLPKPPTQYIADVQCAAGVRYGEIAVSEMDATKAHLVAIELCEVAAQCVALALGRTLPVINEPLFDGLPLYEFIEKNRQPLDDFIDKEKTMPKIDKQGIVTVTSNPDGSAQVELSLYALSLAATRREDQNLRVDHIASSSDAETEEEAINQGLKEAREKWPSSEGWDVDVQVKPLRLQMLLNSAASGTDTPI